MTRNQNPWEVRWRREAGTSVRGGQSASFVATSRDSGSKAFLKTLLRHRENNLRARRRFRREAVAYETLTGLGPPTLLDDNSETWLDSGRPMYMALEYIDGPNLQSYVQQHGPLVEVDSALACVGRLAEVLHSCHENNVTHRDVKPANIVLREGAPTEPVLVDFGLSFNDEGEDDLTRVGEEVGNRFLRLPEHAFGSRATGSDVTQLAGVLLYILTGIEPRVLVDQAGLMPHQRPEIRALLMERLEERQCLRLLRVLDRAFTPDLSARYGTAPDLVADLERAMTSNTNEGDDLDQLIAQVDDFATSRNLPALHALRTKLTGLQQKMNTTIIHFAEAKGLKRFAKGMKAHVTAEEQWATIELAIAVDDQQPNYAEFRLESRGPHEIGLLVAAEEVWRGDQPDQAFTDAVIKEVVKKFLSGQQA
ncbi:MAG: protein kinase [Actinomycetia bacterium]|nr:protein kinase [Actinomycetes bacterium]